MSEIRAVVAQTPAFLVAIGTQANFDQVVVAASLALALRAAGKRVSLVAPKAVVLVNQPELQSVVGVTEFSPELTHQNLVVSFAYSDASVDSVSYAIDEARQRFILTIKPKAGEAPLDAATLSASYAGSEAAVSFLVGIHDLTQLSEVYQANAAVFDQSLLVTLHQFAPELAKIALTADANTCLAEAAVGWLEEMGLALTPDVASNLLYGIEFQTDWLSSLRTTATTFAAVAALLQAGARRQTRPKLFGLSEGVLEAPAKLPTATALVRRAPAPAKMPAIASIKSSSGRSGQLGQRRGQKSTSSSALDKKNQAEAFMAALAKTTKTKAKLIKSKSKT